MLEETATQQEQKGVAEEGHAGDPHGPDDNGRWGRGGPRPKDEGDD